MQDRVAHLVDLYDEGAISRRQLLQGIFAIGIGGGAARQASTSGSAGPLVRARTLNHVTLYASDVSRSKAFYQRLTGLPIRDEGKDFCEFKLDAAFLGLYALEPGKRPGFDHFCMGIEGYEARRVHARLADALPDHHPTIEEGDQVYVRDPDGVRVQFADLAYKR